MDSEIEEIVEFMDELTSDSNVPRNVKAKLTSIVEELKSMDDKNMSLILNKLLSDLDDVSGDNNLDSFTRQQLWSITSMLEALN